VLCSDDVAPTLLTAALAHGQSGLTHLTPLLSNFTFSEPVFGVSRSLFAVSGCGFNQVLVSFDGARSYSVAVNCTVSGLLSVRLNTTATALSAVHDAAGNQLASSALQVVANFDATRVHVTLAPSRGQLLLTRVSPVLFNATFSEVVTGVAASAFVASGTGALPGSVSVTALSTHSYQVSVAVTGSGTLVLTTQAGAVYDLAGNSLAGPFPSASVNFGEQSSRSCCSPRSELTLFVMSCCAQTTLPRHC
jgi:hypothetical protein